MSGAADLLRLLEPTVRPGGLPGPSRSPQAPIEGQSFDELLAAARASEPVAASSAAAGETPATVPPPRPLAPLSGMDQINNADLIAMLSRAGGGKDG